MTSLRALAPIAARPRTVTPAVVLAAVLAFFAALPARAQTPSEVLSLEKATNGDGGLPAGTLLASGNNVGSSVAELGDVDGNDVPDTRVGASGGDSGGAVVGTGTFTARPTSVETGGGTTELAAFTATAEGQAVTLAWQTASEKGNVGFVVEQRLASEDGPGAWRERGFVEGAGTTTKAQGYAFHIPNVGYGTYAFRLRRINLDGTSATSEVREASVGLTGPYAVAAYPNPTRSRRATVEVAVRQAQHVTVTVYDVLGRRVATLHDGPLAAGRSERLALSGQGLASGVYLVHVVGETFTATQRVTVVR